MPGLDFIPGITEGGAIILAALGLLTAVITVFGAGVAKSVKSLGAAVGAVRHQVENNHPTNMREESDDRHSEISTLLREVRDDLRQHKKETAGSLGGIRADVRTVTKRLDDHINDERG